MHVYETQWASLQLPCNGNLPLPPLCHLLSPVALTSWNLSFICGGHFCYRPPSPECESLLCTSVHVPSRAKQWGIWRHTPVHKAQRWTASFKSVGVRVWQTCQGATWPLTCLAGPCHLATWCSFPLPCRPLLSFGRMTQAHL